MNEYVIETKIFDKNGKPYKLKKKKCKSEIESSE